MERDARYTNVKSSNMRLLTRLKSVEESITGASCCRKRHCVKPSKEQN